MSIPTSVYVPDATLYASYSSNLVLDIQKAIYALNGQIAPVVNGLFLQDIYANRPAPGTAGRFYFATDTVTLYYDNGSAWKQISFGLIKQTVYAAAASGTFTRDTRTIIARVRAVGAGGAGGGATATDASHFCVGTGAGAGGSCEGWFLPGATESYTVGTGGTGVSGGTGNNGTATTFGTWLTCNGGSGGTVIQLATANSNITTYAAGGTVTTSGGTFVTRSGESGQWGINTTAAYFLAGSGANTLYGVGGRTAVSATGNGPAASGNGAGGGGAANGVSQGANKTGGNGTDGLIIVEEFG